MRAFIELNRAVSGQSGAPVGPSCSPLAAFPGCSGLRVSPLGSLLRPSWGRRGGVWVRRGLRGPPRPSWILSAVLVGCLGVLGAVLRRL
eukprot:1700055-Pyramimonas_sp.AAC.1